MSYVDWVIWYLYDLLIINYSVQLSNELNTLVQKFSEHFHDAWAQRKMEAGWTFGDRFDDHQKINDRIRPFATLDNYQKEAYR